MVVAATRVAQAPILEGRRAKPASACWSCRSRAAPRTRSAPDWTRWSFPTMPPARRPRQATASPSLPAPAWSMPQAWHAVSSWPSIAASYSHAPSPPAASASTESGRSCRAAVTDADSQGEHLVPCAMPPPLPLLQALRRRRRPRPRRPAPVEPARASTRLPELLPPRRCRRGAWPSRPGCIWRCGECGAWARVDRPASGAHTTHGTGCLLDVPVSEEHPGGVCGLYGSSHARATRALSHSCDATPGRARPARRGARRTTTRARIAAASTLRPLPRGRETGGPR